MALCISRAKGESFWVQDSNCPITKGPVEVLVTEVFRTGHFILQVGEDSFEIVDDRSEEVIDEVYISAGQGGHPQQARVAIDAPKYLRISRDRPIR